jgi:hypothetical protein
LLSSPSQVHRPAAISQLGSFSQPDRRPATHAAQRELSRRTTGLIKLWDQIQKLTSGFKPPVTNSSSESNSTKVTAN